MTVRGIPTSKIVVVAMVSGITGVCETSNDFFFGGGDLLTGRQSVEIASCSPNSWGSPKLKQVIFSILVEK